MNPDHLFLSLLLTHIRTITYPFKWASLTWFLPVSDAFHQQNHPSCSPSESKGPPVAMGAQRSETTGSEVLVVGVATQIQVMWVVFCVATTFNHIKLK